MTIATYLSGLQHCRCGNARVVPPVLTCTTRSAAKRNQIVSSQQNKHATQCGHQQTPRQPVVQCQANGATNSSSLQMIDVQAPKRRRLIIMRHADSIERTDPQTRDHERCITDMGRKAAQQTAQMLHEKGWLPEVVMSSNSERTRQTLEAMREAVDAFRHAETHFRGSLYTIAALDGMTRKHLQNVIVDACRQSMHDCVLCLGHNKGWEEAATSFAGHPVRLETANAALLEGSGETWADAFANDSDWKLVGILVP
ncbi:TPA: hypothetical protein ACH3X2_004252 [Trebouxia sp. C0005]|nr:MAG: phosphoglycerate mutase family [Trebouxia sp. A1-2]